MQEKQIQILQSEPKDNEQHLQFDKTLRVYIHHGLTVFGRQTDLNYYHSITNTGYNNGAIYIAKRDEKIVGRVFLGVKQIYFQGKYQQVSYMIDLQAFNNEFSIFKNLIDHVIQVSNDQFKSAFIYLAYRPIIMHQNQQDVLNQLGFNDLSQRKLCVNSNFLQDEPIIIQQIIQDKAVKYCKLNERNIVADYICQNYQENDMFVEKEELITQILYNQNYKGCYIVETEENDRITAGICLFIDRRVHSNTLISFLKLSFRQISHQYFYLVINSIYSLLVLFFMLFLIQQFQIPYFYAIFGVLIAYMCTFLIIDKYVRWAQIQTKPILRIFSPFFIGSKEYENQMFAFLLSNLMKEEELQDSLMIIANLDQNNQYLKHFNNQNGFVTQQKQAKYIYKNFNLEEQNYQISECSFFDPRDI